LFFDWDDSTPANSAWYFREDFGSAYESNYVIKVNYYDGAIARTPSMGFLGIVIVILMISLAIIKRNV